MRARIGSLFVAAGVLLAVACESGGGEPSFPFVPPDTGSVNWGGRDTGSTPTPDVAQPGGADVEPSCGNCPADRPVCEGSACVCTPTSCGVGHWCHAGRCQPCTTDEHCGAGCEDCQAKGEVCAEGGGQCVSCLSDEDCDPAFRCEFGACYACNTTEHCGPDCIACPADLPECRGGSCVCNESSCPPGQWCWGMSCAPCDTAAHCGFECEDCTLGDTPVCNGGLCRCQADADCGAGRWCNNGACEDCTDGDPLHCGATCAVCAGSAPLCSGGRCVCASNADCGAGYWCDGQGCVPCDEPLHCGATCAPCSLSAPLCHEGACVRCATGDDCDPAHYCEQAECHPCADDDPAHCGPSCAACEGGETFCVDGACTCDATSCGPYHRCSSGACLLCDDARYCGASCGACGGATPYCALDGSSCVACAQNSHCPAGQRCWNGNCVPDCFALGCASAPGMSADTCASPPVIGRREASGGITLAGTLDLATNSDDRGGFLGTCTGDNGRDNFYQIYLSPGDRLEVELDIATYGYMSLLKLYRGLGCDAAGAELALCVNEDEIGSDESFSYTATSLGWHVIVVDSESWEQYAPAYTLRVTLTCPHAACCCYAAP